MESQRSWDVWQSQASTRPVSSFADVNVAFQQSAHKVLLDDDNLLPLLHLTIEYHGKEHKGLVSDSLGPRGLQDAGLPCPSPTQGACSNSCPSNQ